MRLLRTRERTLEELAEHLCHEECEHVPEEGEDRHCDVCTLKHLRGLFPTSPDETCS